MLLCVWQQTFSNYRIFTVPAKQGRVAWKRQRQGYFHHNCWPVRPVDWSRGASWELGKEGGRVYFSLSGARFDVNRAGNIAVYNRSARAIDERLGKLAKTKTFRCSIVCSIKVEILGNMLQVNLSLELWHRCDFYTFQTKSIFYKFQKCRDCLFCLSHFRRRIP